MTAKSSAVLVISMVGIDLYIFVIHFRDKRPTPHVKGSLGGRCVSSIELKLRRTP